VSLVYVGLISKITLMSASGLPLSFGSPHVRMELKAPWP
jgi:hypothetical protein